MSSLPPAECQHDPGYRYYYSDPNTGVAYEACRACGLTIGPLRRDDPELDNLTMRLRPHDAAEDGEQE